MKDLTGKLLVNRFYLERFLGRGGSGAVYLAEDRDCGSLAKKWVVKWVDRQESGQWFEYYKNEARILERLRHPNMSAIHYCAETPEGFFMVLDYIEGTTLSQVIKRQGRVPERCAATWMRTVCAVLDYLHSVGDKPVIYCDLNPNNIMVTGEKTIYLLDYGIAREMQAEGGPVLGTRGFAAPEQYADGAGNLDARTDVYGVGATLFSLLTGRPPLETSHPGTICPELSSKMDNLVAKCLRKNPDDRYQTMAELCQALDKLSEKRALTEQRRLMLLRSVILAAVFCLIGVVASGILIFTENQRSGEMWILSGDEKWAKGDSSGARLDYLRGLRYTPRRTEAYEKIYAGMLSENSAEDICSFFRDKTDKKYFTPDFALRLAMTAIETGRDPWLSYAKTLLNSVCRKGSKQQRGLAQTIFPLIEAPPEEQLEDDLKNLEDHCGDLEEYRTETLYLLLTVMARTEATQEDFDRVVQKLETAMAADDNFYEAPRLFKFLACHYYSLAQEKSDTSARQILEKSAVYLEKLGEVSGDIDIWILRGKVWSALGENQKARDSLTHALNLEPENAQILVDLAELCLTDDPVSAREYYRRLVALGKIGASEPLLKQINALAKALAMEK